jgi:radical SAM-linked protein
LEGVFALSDLRIKFIRGEEVKFISHLDLMKVFERAARRVNIPIAFSQGFNPHAHLIFGLPLSVGVTSQAEYADIELTEIIEPESFVTRLNHELPKGLIIVEAKDRQAKVNIMASIGAAIYEILISVPEDLEIIDFQEDIASFLAKEEIIVKKEGKKGIRELDIKTMILQIKLKDMKKEFNNSEVDTYLQNYIKAQTDISLLPPTYSLKNIFCITALLSAGSVANLKPELLFAAIKEFTQKDVRLIKIHRSGLLVSQGGSLINPLDASAL